MRRSVVLTGAAMLAIAGGGGRAAEPGATPVGDLAAKFGAREGVINASLSPDGTKVAFLAPGPGQGTVLYTVDALSGADPKPALVSNGAPNVVRACNWVTNNRLVCTVTAAEQMAEYIVTRSTLVAVDADGRNQKMVSRRQGDDALYRTGYGGEIVDPLPGQNGFVLMARQYVPEERIGTLVNKSRRGLGVDRVDTRTLNATRVEPPAPEAIEYISDGAGTIRIMGAVSATNDGQYKPDIRYSYRKDGSRDWQALSVHNSVTDTGFDPYAVDGKANIAYGLAPYQGRLALYGVALDGSMRQTVLYANPRVDVDGPLRLGRGGRVIGASYAIERREAVYFDPEIGQLMQSLSKALPAGSNLRIIDVSLDQQKMLLRAEADTDAGRYYLFDRATKKLTAILLSRPELADVRLAPVKAVSYRAADGTMVPAYLTLPAGSNGRGLPAIVMPHGGPGARDEWGFDWLSQYYAARGFAVLQPNFRGSTGYGEEWLHKNGFQSWPIAIGDVTAAGHWLLSEGIAAPGKLAIVGWSYGGYAALQSAVTDPDLFKAVVAIAPVTDLTMLRGQQRGYSNFTINRDFIGTGPHLRTGSPAQNVAAITAPVLLFHGDMDQNVRVEESQLMADRLKAAAKPYGFVLYKGSDHYIEDAVQRTDMLRRSDAFLRKWLAL